MGIKHRSPLKPLPVIEEPWQRLAIDIVGPLPKSKGGFKYLLTAMDFVSRYPEAIPLKRVDAETVSDALLQIFSRYGVPQEILSDNGTPFTAKYTQTLMKALDITTIWTSPYHPQTNSMLERWHRTLKTILSKLDTPESWTTTLPMALFAIRDSSHQATGFSPFQLLFAHKVNGPTAILHRMWTGNKKTPQKISSYIQSLRQKMAQTVALANTKEEQTKKEVKATYDSGTEEDQLQPGDEVLLLHPSVMAGWKAWQGPCVVQKQVSPVTYKLNTPGKRGAVIHRNSLKRFVRTAQVNHVVIADGQLDGSGQLELPGLPGRDTDSDNERAAQAREALTPNQREELDKLLKGHQQLFSTIPGFTDITAMEINTRTNKPTNIPPYRIPVRWKEKVQKEIQTLLDLDIIRPSKSAWAAPIVCVAKPDGSLRMCVNFRGLNRTTQTDTYPMPRVEELID